MVAAQRDVLLGYLGTPAAALHADAAVPAETPGVTAAAAAPVPVAPAPEPPVRAELGFDQVLAAVLAVVSERTGYPTDMLDTDLDLEADLSIDSIKRTEILGELTDRIELAAGGGVADESVLGELARLKTLRGLGDWLV